MLFPHSVIKYYSSYLHSSLTYIQSYKLEAIQKTRLRVILGVLYVSNSTALETCGPELLSTWRKSRSLRFKLKCLKNPVNKFLDFILNTFMQKANDLTPFEPSFNHRNKHCLGLTPTPYTYEIGRIEHLEINTQRNI